MIHDNNILEVELVQYICVSKIYIPYINNTQDTISIQILGHSQTGVSKVQRKPFILSEIQESSEKLLWDISTFFNTLIAVTTVLIFPFMTDHFNTKIIFFNLQSFSSSYEINQPVVLKVWLNFVLFLNRPIKWMYLFVKWGLYIFELINRLNCFSTFTEMVYVSKKHFFIWVWYVYEWCRNLVGF